MSPKKYAGQKLRLARWHKANPERRRAYNQKCNSAITTKISKSLWQSENKAKRNVLNAKRRAALLNATPEWLTEEQHQLMLTIYEEAIRLQKEVDHIVPLKGRNVSGLHVPWNLQLLSKKENRKKYNKYGEETARLEAVASGQEASSIQATS